MTLEVQLLTMYLLLSIALLAQGFGKSEQRMPTDVPQHRDTIMQQRQRQHQTVAVLFFFVRALQEMSFSHARYSPS